MFIAKCSVVNELVERVWLHSALSASPKAVWWRASGDDSESAANKEKGGPPGHTVRSAAGKLKKQYSKNVYVKLSSIVYGVSLSCHRL